MGPPFFLRNTTEKCPTPPSSFSQQKREIIMTANHQLWVPATKRELVHSLSSVYQGKSEQFLRMPKRQLMAIFFYLRRQHGYFS
jgi:hypothetical protein